MCYNHLPNITRPRGDIEAAHRLYIEALMIARELNDRSAEGLYMSCIAGINEDRGDTSAARQGYQHALSIAKEIGERTWQANALNNLARLDRSEGFFDQALRGEHEALAIAQALGDRRLEATIHLELGRIFAATHARAAAQQAFHNAEKLARDLKLRLVLIHVLSLRGLFDLDRGLIQSAHDALLEAEQHLDALGNIAANAPIRRDITRLQRALGSDPPPITSSPKS